MYTVYFIVYVLQALRELSGQKNALYWLLKIQGVELYIKLFRLRVNTLAVYFSTFRSH